jgi:CRP/FNR family cyclic AMP-dependent transcriptional regulator
MGISTAVDLRPASVKTTQAAAPRPCPCNTRFNTKIEEGQAFDAQALFDMASAAREVLKYSGGEVVFTRGDRATTVLYIQEGCVKLTALNKAGKEAVAAVLCQGDFLGVRCLAGQPQRAWTAVTITPSTIVVIEKSKMIRLLHTESALRDLFIKHMLSRKDRTEEGLVDQLFNSTKKRLARRLLLLAGCCKQDKPENMVPGISQEMLAEMIGTTRSQVNRLMTRFRTLGYIKYGGWLRGMQINRPLLSAVLQD